MVAIDTIILIYAHRQEAPHHIAAAELIESLVHAREEWAIPWPCVHEFLAVITNPKVFKPPTPLPIAIEQVRSLASCGVQLLSEGTQHLETLAEISVTSGLRGGQIHDARIAAICLENGVSTLYSADRDFSRLRRLKVVNPLP